MTHTLHPEIENEIKNLFVEFANKHTDCQMFIDLVSKHLGPYLKDRTTRTMTEHMMEAEEKIRQMHEAIKRKDGEITILGNTYRLVDKELPPSQHLKDEPTQTLQDFAANQMNVDDMKKDGSFINKVEDNEPLPESKSKNILQNGQPKVDWSEGDDIQYYRHDGYGGGRRIPGKLKQWVKAIIHAGDIHGIVNFGEIRKPVFEEELKQSTPKIEKIELTKDDDYWGDTHKKLNEVIDYINNKD